MVKVYLLRKYENSNSLVLSGEWVADGVIETNKDLLSSWNRLRAGFEYVIEKIDPTTHKSTLTECTIVSFKTKIIDKNTYQISLELT